MREDKTVYEAKKSLDAHIKFLTSLKNHLHGNNLQLKGRAMWAAWCIHRYFNDGLVNDIEQAMRQHGNSAANED